MPTPRMLTGVKGFDSICHGGVLRTGIYIFIGHPGAGKTVLGNQLCFNHVAAGGRALYIPLLSETHTQMFSHMQPMSFFTPEPVGRTLFYFSGYGVLLREGLSGLLEFLRKAINEQRRTLLVLDGLVTAEVLAGSGLELKQFLSSLHAFMEAHGCTGFLLNHPGAEQHFNSVYTVVDGLFELKTRLIGERTAREIQIHKLRGSDFSEGRHAYEITDEGLVVHPRTEAASLALPHEPIARDRMRFGVPQLDTMLDGGLLTGSNTMLLGVPGSGKTLLGLNFLTTGAREGQPGLYFGFNEPPNKLVDSATQIGLDMTNYMAGERIHVIWQPPLDNLLDALAEQLLTAVQQHKTQRLFIDGFGGFEEALADPERINRFFVALSGQLYALHVTTLFSVEINNLFGPVVEVPIGAASAVADNIIFLRYVELRSTLYRLLSVLKSRRSRHDTTIHEFSITDMGLEVARTADSAEAILKGVATPITSNAMSSRSTKRPSQK